MTSILSQCRVGVAPVSLSASLGLTALTCWIWTAWGMVHAVVHLTFSQPLAQANTLQLLSAPPFDVKAVFPPAPPKTVTAPSTLLPAVALKPAAYSPYQSSSLLLTPFSETVASAVPVPTRPNFTLSSNAPLSVPMPKMRSPTICECLVLQHWHGVSRWRPLRAVLFSDTTGTTCTRVLTFCRDVLDSYSALLKNPIPPPSPQVLYWRQQRFVGPLLAAWQHYTYEMEMACLLSRWRLVTWCAAILGNIAAASLKEDVYGLVGPLLPSILSALVSCSIACRALANDWRSATQGPDMQIRSVLMACNTAIYQIVDTFGTSLSRVSMPSDLSLKLQAFVKHEE
eukprot:CAMPEP_0184675444 /NCGR_PEP_ID=MMETSP0308-20130426/87787_1 /TAXON_ID=38269 /ORGANISM="Gloeochaete witrockiana, Strain SAG 46.84" /LENGTH=340 /DNA_ID=CAMNT_0027123145 /DNA_START=551 /DNA_END=1576 /DNA_ORIENTATION=-